MKKIVAIILMFFCLVNISAFKVNAEQNTSSQVEYLQSKEILTGNNINNTPMTNIPDIQALSAPTALSCTSKTATSAVLSWTAPSGSGEIKEYEIYQGATVVQQAKADKLTSEVRGLHPQSSYTFTVKAVYADGKRSDESNMVTVLTDKDTQAPTTPKGLKAYCLQDTSITLAWDNSEDNDYVAGYEIYRGDKKVGTSNTNKYKDISLTKNTVYSYTVKAYDASGNKSELCSAVKLSTIGDDHGNDISSATPLELGVEEAGGIQSSGDVDYYSYRCSLNGDYVIETTGSTDVDGLLYSRANGDIIGSSNDISKDNTNFSIKHYLYVDTTYYIKIVHNSESGTGRYSVKIRKLSGISQPSGKFVSIAAGENHSLAVKDDGTVWAWGSDMDEFLTSKERYTPEQVENLNGVVAVSAGRQFSVALKGDGTVWEWDYMNGPVQLQNLTGVVAISAGGYHILALKDDGTVWAWGDNQQGQLGGERRSTYDSIPVQTYSLNGVISIAAGEDYSLAVKDDGTAWSWGNNEEGQLGDGTTTNRYSPVQVRNLTGVVTVEAGDGHSLAIKNDGTAWGWGLNRYGQLGDGTTTNRYLPVHVPGLDNAVSLSAGYMHSMIIKNDGTVWTFGYNRWGQLGSGTTDSKTPVKVLGLAGVTAIAGSNHSMALKQDGSIWTWGSNRYGQLGNGTSEHIPMQISDLTKVEAIAAGSDHSLALKKDGTVWAWGDNEEGQLGNGTMTGYTPIKVQNFAEVSSISAGSEYNLAIKNDGTVWTYGRIAYLISMFQSSVQIFNYPVQVQGLSGIVSANAGGQPYSNLSLALRNDGTVWSWGDNDDGQLGDGRATVGRGNPAQIQDLTDVKAIAAGDNHSLALRKNGTVWEWGFHYYESSSKQYIPVQVQGLEGVIAVSDGYEHSLALKDDGTVWAWGNNSFGELGDGTENAKYRPVQVKGLTGIIAIAAGYAHSLALREDGTVWTWGSNCCGQTGDGSPIIPTGIPTPLQVQGLTGVTSIAAGENYSMALKNDGTVWTWGQNEFGQLGRPNIEPQKVLFNYSNSTKTPKTTSPRSSLNAFAADGKIYIAGGTDYKSTDIKVESLDTSTFQWTSKNSTAPQRWGAGTTQLGGKIYMAGGNNGTCLKSMYSYDTAADTWSECGDMHEARYDFGMVEANGRLYAIGGVNDTGYLDSVEEYDPATSTWTKKNGKMKTPRAGFASALVNGKIYVFGGHNKDGECLDTVEMYDPISDTWSEINSMPTPRTGCKAVVLNGKIYVIGGYDGRYLTITEAYDPVSNTWESVPGLGTARMDFGAAVMDNSIYIIGGKDGTGCLDSVERLDIQ